MGNRKGEGGEVLVDELARQRVQQIMQRGGGIWKMGVRLGRPAAAGKCVGLHGHPLNALLCLVLLSFC